jgi:phage-related minor tail protein
MNEEFKVKGEELLAKIKQLFHEGNISRIIIKDEEGKVYLEIPVTIGVIGAVFAPVLAAVGALAALAANFTIEVVRKELRVQCLNY